MEPCSTCCPTCSKLSKGLWRSRSHLEGSVTCNCYVLHHNQKILWQLCTVVFQVILWSCSVQKSCKPGKNLPCEKIGLAKTKNSGKTPEKKIVGNLSEYSWEKSGEIKKKLFCRSGFPLASLLNFDLFIYLFTFFFTIGEILTGHKTKQGMFLSVHRKIVLKQKEMKLCRSGFPFLLSSLSNFESFFFFFFLHYSRNTSRAFKKKEGMFLSVHRKIVVKQKILKGVEVGLHASCIPSRISSFFLFFCTPGPYKQEWV